MFEIYVGSMYSHNLAFIVKETIPRFQSTGSNIRNIGLGKVISKIIKMSLILKNASHL